MIAITRFQSPRPEPLGHGLSQKPPLLVSNKGSSQFSSLRHAEWTVSQFQCIHQNLGVKNDGSFVGCLVTVQGFVNQRVFMIR